MGRDHFLRRTILGLTALAAAASGACFWQDDDDIFVIPPEYAVADETYTLLYSTLGYDLAGTKRVLIRLNDPEADVPTGLAFQWRLVDEQDRVVEVGNAPYGGDAWGIPIWIADFTGVDDSGTFRMALEAPDVVLATDAFPVDDYVLFRRTFVPVALENAEVRAAPIELDGGYYEDTTVEGTAVAHAEFLLGLLAAYEARRPSMTDAMRERTRDAITRALDYLLLLSDPATGQFDHTAPTRPYQGLYPEDTLAGARALARYAAIFQREDPTGADRAYRRARLADAWIIETEDEIYTPWAEAAVAYDFYRYSSVQEELDRAAERVRGFVEDYDLAEMDRSSFDTEAHLETMFRMWQDIPSHPDRSLWEASAVTIGAQYREFVERNPFDVVAPGVADGDEATPLEQWESMEDVPPPGEGEDTIIGNEWFLGRVADAVYLARMTDDDTVAEAAAGNMLWVSGLNPGIDAERVPGSEGEAPFVAASFVGGLDARAPHPFADWEWQRTRPIGMVLGGFHAAFWFDENAVASSPSIIREGMWLRAVVLYEDLLHPGGRAEEPEESFAFDPEQEMRVTSVVASAETGRLSMSITVVDPAGDPLAAVHVSVAWRASPVPGTAPEALLRTSSCETGAEGVCVASIDEGELVGTRPITAVVTNLEHDDHETFAATDTFGEAVVFE